jgi:hypothetical protein
VNCPQTVSSREQSTFADRSQTQFARERGLAKSDLRRRIAVSAWASVNFRVYIQIFPAHVLI